MSNGAITLKEAYDAATRHNVHKKAIGFALVVVYERESDRPFVSVAARSAEGDKKLAHLLDHIEEQLRETTEA